MTGVDSLKGAPSELQQLVAESARDRGSTVTGRVNESASNLNAPEREAARTRKARRTRGRERAASESVPA